MSTELRVGVVGATGAIGREVIRVLDRATWRPDHLVALARSSTSVSQVDYGEERVPVDDIDDEALGGLDALIIAVPEEAALAIGHLAIDEGVPTVDVSGALRRDTDVPTTVPWINPEVLMQAPRGVVALPSGGALLLASILGPLARAGLEGPVEAHVLLPASAWGQGGVDELAAQVRALFNGETPPRRTFEHGLAFDLISADGPLDDDGSTPRERRIAEDLFRLLGLRPESQAITVTGVPVFSGLSASLALRTARRADTALVERILADGGVVMPQTASSLDVPRPRRVEGRPFAHAGRTRVGDDGVLRVWATMDNLRTVATAAVAATAALLRVGRAAAEA